MKPSAHIIRDNERRAGFRFSIHIDATAADVQKFYGSDEHAATLLQNELEAWLESLTYVRRFAVLRRAR